MKSNLWKIYAGTIFYNMLFLGAILVPFLGYFGLTMTEIMLTEVAYTLTIAIFEIPSGYFADIYGRKKSIIIGIVAIIIGMLFYTFGDTFLLFCIGGIMWGIGISFVSGTDQALLYETLIQLKRKNEYKKISGDIIFYSRISFALSALIGGYLASINLLYPFYASIIAYIIWFFISLLLNETKHSEKQGLETWNHFKNIFKESFLNNKKIKYFIIFTGIGGFFHLNTWFNQKYLEFLDIKIMYFGLIVGITGLASGLGSKYSEKIENFIGFKKLLLIIPIILFFIWFTMGIINTQLVIILMILVSFVGGAQIPVFNDYIQKNISSDRRATIMSLMSLFQKIVFFIFAPILGYATDIYSVQTAFLLMSLFILIFTVTNIYFLKKAKII